LGRKGLNSVGVFSAEIAHARRAWTQNRNANSPGFHLPLPVNPVNVSF
jgi:hypothetical protein